MAHTSEGANAEGETGRGVGGCLEGWSGAAIREGQAQLDWRRCGHFRHGSTSSPLHWACKPRIAARASLLSPQLPPLPPSLPLASHPHAEQERYASQPVDGISEQCTTRGPTSGLISEDDPDMVMFTMQEMLQIDPRTINSHLQISHLVKETKRAPCSPTEPYTAA